MAISAQPLDIVIAWVDGDDPVLKEKRAKYQVSTQASLAVSATRFASDHEIYYNLASILKYVPFCRHIYIVTDQQQPTYLHQFVQQQICASDKIRVVDHREIFKGFEQYLPTFNTRSIESMLWNIEGLSDYFIYLNDDFFFNQPAELSDFLEQGQMVIHGHWRTNLLLKLKLNYRTFLNKKFAKPIQPKHMLAQMRSADILGMNQFFEIHHYPHIVDRQILKNYLLAHPDRLRQQIQFKFRDIAQVNPITLMNHLKIQANQAELKADIEIAYLSREDKINHFIADLDNPMIKYGCVQSMDGYRPALQQRIHQALINKFSDYLPERILQEHKIEKTLCGN